MTAAGRITMAEIAASWPHLGGPEQAASVLAAAGYAVTPDELGRDTVARADAVRWRESVRVAEAAEVRRQRDFAQWRKDCDTWAAGRSEAAQAAARRARASTRGGDGEQMTAGQEAATRAAEDYERREPRPTFDGKPGPALAYVDESEAPSSGGRVKAAARRLANGAGVLS